MYEVDVPLTVDERLPGRGGGRGAEDRPGDPGGLGFPLSDSWKPMSGSCSRRLLTASGVGARLALAMLSTFSARRLAQALAEKDLAALTQVSGVGKKKAERLALELSEKVGDLALGSDPGSGAPGGVGGGAQGAVSALMALGLQPSPTPMPLSGGPQEGRRSLHGRVDHDRPSRGR